MGEYLNRGAAADELSRLLGRKVTKGTLEKLAERGQGPPYVILLNQASYPRDGLRAWLESAAQSPRKRGSRDGSGHAAAA